MTASRSCSVPTPLPIYLPPTYCVTQPASIPRHTPSPPMPPLVPLPRTSSKCRETEIITQEHVTTLPQPHPRVPSASISSHTPLPHSQYIQPLSRVPSARSPHIHPLPIHNTYSFHLVSQPASISPHTFYLASSPSLPTLCVGVAFATLCVIFRQGYLWLEASVKRFLCTYSDDRWCQLFVMLSFCMKMAMIIVSYW